MSKLTTQLGRQVNGASALGPNAPVLIRRFVETADERCPLAGIWMPLPASDTGADDPEIAWPAMWRLLLWRAIHPALTNLVYCEL